jgi:hypothetical protein
VGAQPGQRQGVPGAGEHHPGGRAVHEPRRGGDPVLAAQRPRLRAQAQPAPTQAAASADAQNTLVLTLTSQIARLKKQHRQEVRALRDALEQAHGENLDVRRELARRCGTTPPRSGVIDPADHVTSIEATI